MAHWFNMICAGIWQGDDERGFKARHTSPASSSGDRGDLNFIAPLISTCMQEHQTSMMDGAKAFSGSSREMINNGV
jgi:hypothetical protein